MRLIVGFISLVFTVVLGIALAMFWHQFFNEWTPPLVVSIFVFLFMQSFMGHDKQAGLIGFIALGEMAFLITLYKLS